MISALVPILYALAVLLWMSVVAVNPDIPLSPAPFLLAPILFLAGGRIQKLFPGGFSPWDAVTSLAQVLLGAFLVGGITYKLGAMPGSISGGDGIAASLLAGLVMSLSEPAALSRGEPRGSAPPARSSGLAALLERTALLSLSLGALLTPALGRLIAPVPEGSGAGLEFLRPILDLAKGFTAGAAVGIAGWVLLRFVRAEPARSALRIALAEATAIAAAALGSESAPLSAITAGLLCAGEPIAGSREAPGDPDFQGSEPFAGARLVAFLSGAGIFLLAASDLDLDRLGSALPVGAVLWSGSAVLRFLVQFGFGGLRRLSRPGEIPRRWLPALAWGSHPGAASLGLFLVARGAVRGAVMADLEAALLLAVLMALLFQGMTAGAALLRAERPPLPAGVRERWMKLRARAVALRAEREAVRGLRSRGHLDEAAAGAMEEAILAAERGVEMEQEEASAAEPRLAAEEITRAVRLVLAAARRAVAEAREEGQIDREAAREVERDLERRWLRSGTVSLRELLGEDPGRLQPPSIPPEEP